MTDVLAGQPTGWLQIADAPRHLGAVGIALVDWLERTVARPQPLLGRPGPLCPFVPITMRLGLLFVVVAGAGDDATALIRAQAALFRTAPPSMPDPAAVNKSVLVVFPEHEGGVLTEAVGRVKAELIASGLTCGEFYPRSDDCSARAEGVRVARSPVPLVAIRYLTPHDRLFLAHHEKYGSLFEQWSAADD